MKMGVKISTHMVDLLFTLALFCVFAASALMVVLIGATVYKNTVRQMDENYSGSTSITYVSTKIRQNDALDRVRVEEMEGTAVLLLDVPVGEETYQTRIYYHDGALKESFSSVDMPFDPAVGQVIVEVQEFQLASEQGVVYLTAVDANGKKSSQLVVLRSSLGS